MVESSSCQGGRARAGDAEVPPAEQLGGQRLAQRLVAARRRYERAPVRVRGPALCRPRRNNERKLL